MSSTVWSPAAAGLAPQRPPSGSGAAWMLAFNEERRVERLVRLPSHLRPGDGRKQFVNTFINKLSKSDHHLPSHADSLINLQ